MRARSGFDERADRLDEGAHASRDLPETGRLGIVESLSDLGTNDAQTRSGRGGTPRIADSDPGRSHGSVGAGRKLHVNGQQKDAVVLHPSSSASV